MALIYVSLAQQAATENLTGNWAARNVNNTEGTVRSTYFNLKHENGKITQRRTWKQSVPSAVADGYEVEARWQLSTLRVRRPATPGGTDRIRLWGKAMIKPVPRDAGFTNKINDRLFLRRQITNKKKTA